MSDSRSDEPLKATGTSSMERLVIEKERLKQAKYMSLYKDLLRRNRGLLQEQREEDQADFAEEAALLKEAISSQRKVWIAGFGIGMLTFLSLRYLPHYVIRRFGGKDRVKALEEAEQQAKINGTAWVRKATGTVDLHSAHRGSYRQCQEFA